MFTVTFNDVEFSEATSELIYSRVEQYLNNPTSAPIMGSFFTPIINEVVNRTVVTQKQYSELMSINSLLHDETELLTRFHHQNLHLADMLIECHKKEKEVTPWFGMDPKDAK